MLKKDFLSHRYPQYISAELKGRISLMPSWLIVFACGYRGVGQYFTSLFFALSHCQVLESFTLIRLEFSFRATDSFLRALATGIHNIRVISAGMASFLTLWNLGWPVKNNTLCWMLFVRRWDCTEHISLLRRAFSGLYHNSSLMGLFWPPDIISEYIGQIIIVESSRFGHLAGPYDHKYHHLL